MNEQHGARSTKEWVESVTKDVIPLHEALDRMTDEMNKLGAKTLGRMQFGRGRGLTLSNLWARLEQLQVAVDRNFRAVQVDQMDSARIVGGVLRRVEQVEASQHQLRDRVAELSNLVQRLSPRTEGLADEVKSLSRHG